MNVRDEDDIIRETLSYAAGIYDEVIVVDCGSEDDTVRYVQQVAARRDNVKFLGCVGKLAPDQVRRHVWVRFRNKLSARDWWAIADADEFVATDLREAVGYGANTGADHIIGESVNFYYTEREFCAWQAGIETTADRARSIRDRRRYYAISSMQIRAFRNYRWLRWNCDTSWPAKLSKPCDRTVRYYHYQYRDVPQIEKRIKIRREMRHLATAADTHWEKRAIEDAISSNDDTNLTLYTGGEYIRTQNSPPLPSPQGRVRTAAKYARNIAYGVVTKQRDDHRFPELFRDL